PSFIENHSRFAFPTLPRRAQTSLSSPREIVAELDLSNLQPRFEMLIDAICSGLRNVNVAFEEAKSIISNIIESMENKSVENILPYVADIFNVFFIIENEARQKINSFGENKNIAITLCDC